jgi:predicted amidophosphoribosyltransferase
MSNQRKWQLNKRAVGLCTQCGSASLVTKNHCELCAAKNSRRLPGKDYTSHAQAKDRRAAIAKQYKPGETLKQAAARLDTPVGIVYLALREHNIERNPRGRPRGGGS